MAAVAFTVEGIRFPLGMLHTRTAIQSDGEQGFVAGRAVYEHPERRIPLVWQDATPAEVEQIRRLADETLGGVMRMTWTPIDGSDAFDVRFAGPIEYERRALNLYRVSFELEEAL